MWAYALSGPRAFERVDVPAPDASGLAAGQVLLRTHVVGICGSDLPAYVGLRSGWVYASAGGAGVPGYPAHEIAGEVLASASPEFAVGDLAVGWASYSDALGEYVVTQASDLLTYEDLAPTIAIALQPLACVLNAVDRLGDVRGRRVAVLGQGPIGIYFSYVLKARGAAHVIGVDPRDRESVGPAFGVDEVVRATSDVWAAGLSDSDRPDVVVEAVGHQTGTLGDAIAAVAQDGRVYAFGVNDEDIYPLNMTAMFRRNLTLMSGMTSRRRDSLVDAKSFHAVHPGLLERYVTTVLPVSEVNQAFECALAPAEGQLKVVLGAGPA